MHVKYPTKLDNAFISYSKFKSNKDRKKISKGIKAFGSKELDNQL